MKKITLFLTIAMLFTLGSAPSKPGNSISISADQVTSARDIEVFIENASNFGARPATIILDSSKGDFYFSEPDRSINIYYSNITITSKTGAVISNCGDGIFFDAADADNAIIEGITFICEGLGIAGGSGHNHVIIRNNTFIAGTFAVAMEKASGWMITGNHAKTTSAAIFIINSNNMTVVKNTLDGYTGIYLEGSSANRVFNNNISASWHGVYLSPDSSYNQVISNRILNTHIAGITFNGLRSEYNRVQGNLVTCAKETACQLVVVENPPLSATNIIKGNKFSK